MVIDDNLLLVIILFGLVMIMTGIFGGLILPNMVSTPMSEARQHRNKIAGMIMSSMGMTLCILSFCYFTPEHFMVKNEFTIAEVKSGVIEDISFKQNDGMVITVDGEPIGIDIDHDKDISLIGVDTYPYAYVTPEVGARVDYKTYSYNGTDYASVIAYSAPQKE